MDHSCALENCKWSRCFNQIWALVGFRFFQLRSKLSHVKPFLIITFTFCMNPNLIGSCYTRLKFANLTKSAEGKKILFCEKWNDYDVGPL